MRRLIICAVVALVATLVGPQATGPRGHAANAPFVYKAPDGFVLRNEGGSENAEAKVWVYDEPGDGRPLAVTRTSGDVRAVVHHSPKEMSVEEADLAKLAQEMPRAFEDSCSWTHRRHELRMRSDGARVGLIEGDCQRDVDLSSLGLPSQKIRTRKLQLMFPDDAGTSIVTASYPVDQAARWEPVFEATIAKATGVATRVPSPPAFLYAAWAAAGLVLGWLLAALVGRRSPSSSTSAPSGTAA